jgi:hypothetical protein
LRDVVAGAQLGAAAADKECLLQGFSRQAAHSLEDHCGNGSPAPQAQGCAGREVSTRHPGDLMMARAAAKCLADLGLLGTNVFRAPWEAMLICSPGPF